MHDRNLDFMFQREDKTASVNGGFYFARISNTTISVLQKVSDVLDGERLPMGDQEAINAILLKNKDVKWGFVPSKYIIFGATDRDLPSDLSWVAWHHAVRAVNLKEKAQQLLYIAKKVLPAQIQHLKFPQATEA
ncbi:hypothetical protein WJX73_001554 [Symbiochloris irregularis]|uniref:Nucleotide-diphospho-sugar transferase domain-containing protein n=1 Tax=Symbiochloris irregularis TaxID=706552 RepID=A0AAW1PID0_9CHLO